MKVEAGGEGGREGVKVEGGGEGGGFNVGRCVWSLWDEGRAGWWMGRGEGRVETAGRERGGKDFPGDGSGEGTRKEGGQVSELFPF